MNPSMDLTLLDSLEQDPLILSSNDATDPFTDNFPAAELDPLDPQLLSWPLHLDLDATHSHVTDSDGSAAEGLAVANRAAAHPPIKKEQMPLELFDFAHTPPPPLALAASLAGAPIPSHAAPTSTTPSVARPRGSSPNPKRACAKMEPATALSGVAAAVKPTSPAPSSSGADSESQSANTRLREPLSDADRQKEKLAQRKQRNKESARRYREKQVARRRQLESFTRTLAEQNRELEALHDRLLALACDRRLRAVPLPPGPPRRFAQHHPVAPPLQ